MEHPPRVRRGVFVDVQNLFYCVRSVFARSRLNYEALKEYFTTPEATTFFVAFSYYDPEAERQRNFLSALALMGYRVIAKPIRRLADGTIKANMDIEMTLEILTTATYLDEVVLITGDGDFAPLASYLARQGKRVIVVGPDQLTATELIYACHEFHNLSHIPNVIELEEAF